jgi:fumarate hydratase class II
MSEFRTERDSMGEMKVPAQAYYGAQTQRAVENFPISGRRFQRRFIRALGLIKGACAEVNLELGGLKKQVADAVVQAAAEVADGKLDAEFVLDIYQTGSGTSTNMNANEVIANRAVELLGGKRGDKSVHPNDHVNRGQSSNDVIPAAMNVSILEACERDLRPALERLREALAEKARAWDRIVKIGRTHLMDATPVRLGQEFGGYASQVAHGLRRLELLREHLGELAIGGTAVGTGINTHPEFGRRVAEKLAAATELPFREAQNHFEAQGARDSIVEASGALKTIACSLTKIANDIRLLNSGPRSGLGEVKLPSIQPGSSIMPGKVNPVICETVTQVCAQVVGYDAAVTLGGLSGHLELNVYLPMMLWSVLDAVALLTRACHVFVDKAVAGLEANEERCQGSIEGSLAMCTSLAPIIGYDRAAAIAKQAYATGKTVRQVALEQGVLPADELAKVLDPWAMTEPGGSGEGGG